MQTDDSFSSHHIQLFLLHHLNGVTMTEQISLGTPPHMITERPKDAFYLNHKEDAILW